MGGEVRQVARDWAHPRDDDGQQIPLSREDMPAWTVEQSTHHQMYESCSEGTPISPVIETPEALADWLVDNQASAFGCETASYEAWLKVCQGQDAISGVIKDGRVINGVDYALDVDRRIDALRSEPGGGHQSSGHDSEIERD